MFQTKFQFNYQHSGCINTQGLCLYNVQTDIPNAGVKKKFPERITPGEVVAVVSDDSTPNDNYCAIRAEPDFSEILRKHLLTRE